MWFHKVSLCSVYIWVCVEMISKSDTKKGIVLRGVGKYMEKMKNMHAMRDEGREGQQPSAPGI